MVGYCRLIRSRPTKYARIFSLSQFTPIVLGIYIRLFEKIDCRQTATTYKFLIYKHDIKRKLE